MKLLVKYLFFLIKWLFIMAFSLELISFAIVSASNYIIYGHIREGSKVIYDPYTMFRGKGGIRPTTPCTARPDSPKVRIWVFGGSTTRGQTENDNATIPSYLAQSLNELQPDVCHKVTNFGENSFNSLLEVQYFEKQLIERDDHPDLIIFYDGANESIYFSQHRTPDGHHGYRRARALVESYHKSFFGVFKAVNAALLASFTKEIYDKLMQVKIDLPPDMPELRRHVEDVAKRYAFVNKVSSCYGAHFLVFWQPAQWEEQGEVVLEVKEKEAQHFVNTDRFTNMRNNFTTVYNAISNEIKDRPYFVDFRDVLVKRQQVGYQPDGVHLTDYGREMVAQAMARTLLERRVF